MKNSGFSYWLDRRRLLTGIMAASAIPIAAHARSEPRRLALTFDDAPRDDSAIFDARTRSERLRRALADARVPGATFFIKTLGLIDPAARTRVAAYAEAGHSLANHSHRHRRLSVIGASEYLADIDIARSALQGFGPALRPWFRYPYLDEGRDVGERDAVRRGLRERGLSNGYVTISAQDSAVDRMVNDAKAGGRRIDLATLRRFYLDRTMAAVGHADRLSIAVMGRSAAQVLLLHENDLSALFVVDLVRTLRAARWTIVTPETAYADPIAAIVPDTMALSLGRIGAIGAANGIAPPRPAPPPSGNDDIRAALQAAGIV